MASRALVAVFLALLCGCGQGEAASEPDPPEPAVSYTVDIPAFWQRTTERMSRLSDPRELFSATTVALSWQRTNCEAFAGAAGEGMRADDVVLTLWERGHASNSAWSDFPQRPPAFGPVDDPERGTCGEPPGTMVHWRNFTDSGRHFHTLVRVGPDATHEAAAEAWRILDSLRFDPGYRPNWPASG